MADVAVLEDRTQIATREQLMSMLGEAAEVEHNLMLTYLYAVFTLKSSEDEGLTPEQLKAVRSWRSTIIRVAVEEMGHLALVCNLLCAVGGSPHFTRLNFPIAPGPLPASMSVWLRRFDMETLNHFIFLERPCHADVQDAAAFAPRQTYHRAPIAQSRLMPVAYDYETVGALYDQIICTLETLCDKYGEDHLFVGDESRQVGPNLTPLPGLQIICNLEDAKAAIHTIVEQGEGASEASETSHYKRYLAVKAEFEALLEADPEFEPARPVAENPVMRRPPTPDGKVWVTYPDAAALMDYTNALYVHMLRLLAQAFGRGGDEHEKRVLVNAATDLMYALTPAAEAMTKLPAHEGAETNAGMSFATSRSSAPLPSGTEWRVFVCRFNEIVEVGRDIASISDEVRSSVQMVENIAETFNREAVAIIEKCEAGARN